MIAQFNERVCPIGVGRFTVGESASLCLFYMTSNMYEPILSRHVYQFMSSYMFEIYNVAI